MSLRKEEYKNRLVDKKIKEYLEIFGAVSIEGPKWCGKTWASLNVANSVVFLDDKNNRLKAGLSVDNILEEERPELIDEWNLVPEVWDAVRRKCDEDTKKGKYILTCSTKLTDEKDREKIHHSGAGRIGKIKMNTMSLYEAGFSTGKASITDMYNGTLKNTKNKQVTLEELASHIIRGGWPSNSNTNENKIGELPKSYIEALLQKDINDDKKRNRDKMLLLLKSLARNESTLASNATILNDMLEAEEEEKDIIQSRTTFDDYLDALNRLNIIENQIAYSENYRSKARLGKNPKRHFTDVSLACAILDLSKEKLLNDIKTFGLMFEALCERDLRIYMDFLNGKLYHMRDNITGKEVDAILEFENGEYAAVEIKLGLNQFEEAKKNLIDFEKNMIKKPKFKCVIVGYTDVISKDEESNIYVVPITALKP